MINFIKEFLCSTLNKVKNIVNICKLYIKPLRKTDRPVLIVIIKDFNHGRYAFQLLNYLTKAGFDIYLSKSTNFLRNLHNYDRLIFQIPNVQILKKKDFHKLPIPTLLRVNYTEKDISDAGFKKILNIDFDYFVHKIDESCVLKIPYFMHPLISKLNDLGLNKNWEHKRGVFFYGQDDLLSEDILWAKFKLNSRASVFSFLQMSDLKMLKPESFDELMSMIEVRDNEFYFIDGKKFRIPPENWLNVLSSFRFFIATPGMIMPQCHNLVEAISMGVIPILQNPSKFLDGLEDNINCLSFTNIDELPSVIHHAISMSENEISRISKNVIQFYKNNIDPLSFMQLIDKSECKRLRLLYNAEEISLKNL